MCIYVCLYVCACVCMHIYVRNCGTMPHLRRWWYVCVCVHICIFMYVCIHAYAYDKASPHEMRMSASVCIRDAYVCVYHMHTYIVYTYKWQTCTKKAKMSILQPDDALRHVRIQLVYCRSFKLAAMDVLASAHGTYTHTYT
jgi:hypothetical protein